jgi:hypothetical protein
MGREIRKEPFGERVAISMHYNARGIRQISSRECIMVALQFEGIDYPSSSVN